MATSIFVNKKCYACEEENKYPEVGLTNLGTPDYLDGRPSDSHSSVLYMFLQQCLSCGYCAPNINKGNHKYSEIAKTEEYRQQAFNKNYPVTANKYLCWGIIQRELGKFNEVGLAALYASWICDDDKDSKEISAKCRQIAVEYFIKSETVGQSFGDDRKEELLILVDLYRRNGDFESADKICKELFSMSLSETENIKTAFQEDLIEDKDTKRYRIKDALEA